MHRQDETGRIRQTGRTIKWLLSGTFAVDALLRRVTVQLSHGGGRRFESCIAHSHIPWSEGVFGFLENPSFAAGCAPSARMNEYLPSQVDTTWQGHASPPVRSRNI